MKLAVLKESGKLEKRVAISPEMVRRYLALGFEVAIESGAGIASGIPDQAYEEAGARIHDEAEDCLNAAALLLSVEAPPTGVIEQLPIGCLVVGMLSPHDNPDLNAYAARQIDAFALELLPRISRAQGMDVLSSQSNLAGYRAVIDAVALSSKATPMMMTAAGTIKPAKVLVLGAGVAGLQAIATAKRLGAIVTAFDVRKAAKEQVESLGASFIAVDAEAAEGSGGYASETSEDYQKRQGELIAQTLASQDMVITTALIPGKKAPILITKPMVEGMKPGAVIIDLAAQMGGNCALTKPDKTVNAGGVRIVGPTHLPSSIATDASALYARNLYQFVATLLVAEKKLSVKWEDELVTATALTRDGKVTYLASPAPVKPA